jgi:2-polyprenyl-3-methyl-5-hydroxy-6-metoxy-1,4-benzoquinol methylase
MHFYESPAHSDFCKKAYGIDLKQMSFVTLDELGLFTNEIKLLPNAKILDLGCGAGYFADYISKRYRSHVTGIDINKNSIDYVKKHFNDNPYLDFKEMNFNELTFEPSSFDLVYSFDTMYFAKTVENLHALLYKCMEILKPGGMLAVFWSAIPSGHYPEFDAMIEPYAECKPVGAWGTQNKVEYRTFDFTKQEREFFPNALKELHQLRKRFEAEIPDVYEAIDSEFSLCADLCAKGDAGGIYRWLYIFTK